MLLAVSLGFSFKNVLAVFECGHGVTHYELLWRHDQIALCSGNTGIGCGFEFVYLGGDLLSGFSGEFFAFGNDDRDRHSLKMYFVVSKQRLIRNNSADLIFTDQVLCGNDAVNAL